MRTVIASLILLTGLGGSALAQDTAQPAELAPPAAAAPATPPATAAPAAAPSAPAAPAPAVERPTLPTEGNGATVLSVLMRACVPMVQQTKTLEEAAKELGMRRDRRSGVYQAQLGDERPYTIGIRPQGANTNVCAVEINYPVGQEEPIVEALNVWSFLHDPELVLQRNDFATGADNIKRITMAWEHYNETESTGLVFVQLKNPDDTPIERGYDKATLLYSERTF